MLIIAAVAIVVILGIGLFCWARFIEPEWFEFKTLTVPIADLPPAFEGFRITVLSDLHYPLWSDARLIAKAVRLSNDWQPDIVLLTGDLCDRRRADPPIVPFLGDVFSGIENRYGIFAVLGNHDDYYGAENVRREILSSTTIQMVENRAALIRIGRECLAIAGVSDLWGGMADVRAALQDVPDDVPRIFLSHNPDIAEGISGERIDLQVSGHTHGGQVRIPFGPAPKIPSYYGNKYREGLVAGPNHRVYINRGICSIRHIRFWSRPEVTGIILRRADSSAKPTPVWGQRETPAEGETA